MWARAGVVWAEDAGVPDGEGGVIPHPELTDREAVGWCSFDFAQSPIYFVAGAMFLPLLLQSTALQAAGFPDNCPNYNGSFYIDNLQIGQSACTSNCVRQGSDSYCKGAPATVDEWSVHQP
mmetsp:Transcript_8476/g.25306  ORF Transcript_8476/g.25306 Transcript_8476/m.25306 type:complete len:121 (-) Transcript_8476:1888-2250(-)